MHAQVIDAARAGKRVLVVERTSTYVRSDLAEILDAIPDDEVSSVRRAAGNEGVRLMNGGEVRIVRGRDAARGRVADVVLDYAGLGPEGTAPIVASTGGVVL